MGATVGSLTPDQQADVLDATTGTAYFYDLAAQLGRSAAGSAGAAPARDLGTAAARSITVVQRYVAGHPITTDPVFPRLTIGPKAILADPSPAAVTPSEVAAAPTDERCG